MYFANKQRKDKRKSLLNILDESIYQSFQEGCRLTYLNRSMEKIIDDIVKYQEKSLTSDEEEELKLILKPYHLTDEEKNKYICDTLLSLPEYERLVSEHCKDEGEESYIKGKIKDKVNEVEGLQAMLNVIFEILKEHHAIAKLADMDITHSSKRQQKWVL